MIKMLSLFSGIGAFEKALSNQNIPFELVNYCEFDDKDVAICSKNGISNTQLYKQAGNSITVDVVEELFCMLFDERGDFYL